ncbi:MAG TPA: hypothetical protein VNX87_00215 [Candidatus Sulfotelmatobacter sp.]|jgi:hypothetical protein|nr:hypothetical protein [Candidatus Sulfotelmatobacter sp.]
MLLLMVLLAPLGASRATAQDDPEPMPLGDVARGLRKKAPPAKPVIDDDNLPQVMQQVDSHDDAASRFRFLMSRDSQGFQVSAPDVSCSLAFTANVKALLSSQYDQMDLPPTEMAKIEGKAVVEGDALTVPVFNGTQWHLSELAIAFTVVKKPRTGVVPWNHEGVSSASADVTPPLAPEIAADAFQQVRPEKRPDVAVIYRMRAAALPWSNAVFSAPLKLELDPGEEWHWAIVQAKGYPPETYVSKETPAAKPATNQALSPSAVSLSTTSPENVLPATPQNAK